MLEGVIAEEGIRNNQKHYWKPKDAEVCCCGIYHYCRTQHKGKIDNRASKNVPPGQRDISLADCSEIYCKRGQCCAKRYQGHANNGIRQPHQPCNYYSLFNNKF